MQQPIQDEKDVFWDTWEWLRSWWSDDPIDLLHWQDVQDAAEVVMWHNFVALDCFLMFHSGVTSSWLHLPIGIVHDLMRALINKSVLLIQRQRLLKLFKVLARIHQMPKPQFLENHRNWSSWRRYDGGRWRCYDSILRYVSLYMIIYDYLIRRWNINICCCHIR